MEIYQARNSPLLPLSPLASCTYDFVALLRGRAIQADAALQQGFPGRICIIPHRSGRRNLDPIASWSWWDWQLLEIYGENDVCFAT